MPSRAFSGSQEGYTLPDLIPLVIERWVQALIARASMQRWVDVFPQALR